MALVDESSSESSVSHDGEDDAPLFTRYLSNDYSIVDETQLQELLTKLINSNESKDKESLNNIILKIIDHSDEEAFGYLLDCGYKIEVINEEQQTAIHLAHENKFLRKVFMYQSNRGLLDNSIININYVDSHGLSLLHIACDAGGQDIVKKLLDNKVNVNEPYLSPSFGVNEKDCNDHGFTPLHFAVKNLRFEISKMLIDHGANVNATDLWSRTPLHLAAQIYVSSEYPARDCEIMELLIENMSDVNSKDALGNTPLLAIFEDFERNVRDRGFVNVQWVYNSRRQKQMKKLDILLNNGADPTEFNNHGGSVLHRIVKDFKAVRVFDCDRSFTFDSHQAQLISKVLNFNRDVDINAKNKRGNSPLDLAITRLSSDVVAVLLEHKADYSKVKFKDKKSYFKCSHIVPNFDQVKNLTRITELLCENGFEMTEKDNVAILKYLVHNFDDCDCWHRRLHKSNDLRKNVTNLFNYGSAVHVSHVITRLMESDHRKSYAFNDVILDIAAFHLKYLKHGGLFLPRRVEEAINKYMLVNDYRNSGYHDSGAKLDGEITQMKSTSLSETLSIFDLMTMPPVKINARIKHLDIDWNIIDKFPLYKNLIRGHVTRSLVRNYVEKSTFDRLKIEFFPLLFDHLCEEIFIYLSNEDILNMNLALVTSDQGKSV